MILAAARKHQAQYKVTLFFTITYTVRHHPIQRIRLTRGQIESHLTSKTPHLTYRRGKPGALGISRTRLKTTSSQYLFLYYLIHEKSPPYIDVYAVLLLK